MSVALCITVVSLFSLCSTDADSVCSAFASSLRIYTPLSNFFPFQFLNLFGCIFVVVVPSAQLKLSITDTFTWLEVFSASFPDISRLRRIFMSVEKM